MTAQKLKTVILPHLPYLVLSWFFSKLGQAYRLSPKTEPALKVMDGIANLNLILREPMPTFHPFDVCVGVIRALMVYGIVWYRRKNAKKWRKDIEYGSARWGNKKDIEPYVDLNPDNNIILTATESLTLDGRPKGYNPARMWETVATGRTEAST